MAWLWTDALAALLVEQDRVAPACLAAWVQRPVAYRIGEDGDPMTLARRLLGGETAPPTAGAAPSP